MPDEHLLHDCIHEGLSLEQVRANVWNLLRSVCDDPAQPLACGQLSNCTPQGPRSRVLILRQVNEPLRQLVSHTDLRSPKIKSLRRDNRVTWLFFDHNCRLQLQVVGTLNVHQDDSIARALWQQAREATRQIYRSPQAPGETAPAPAENFASSAKHLNDQQSFANFAALVTTVTGMDILQLRPTGNLRAEFLWEENGSGKGAGGPDIPVWQSRWVHP